MLRKLTAATQSQITFGRKVHWIDTAAFESSLKRKCRFSYCSSLSKNVIFLFGKKKDWWEWHQHRVGFQELALFYATADGKNFRQFFCCCCRARTRHYSSPLNIRHGAIVDTPIFSKSSLIQSKWISVCYFNEQLRDDFEKIGMSTLVTSIIHVSFTKQERVAI